MLKLLVLPAFFVAVLVGVVAGLQYASGDRARAVETAKGGLVLVLEVIKVMAITIVIVLLMLLGAIFYFTQN